MGAKTKSRAVSVILRFGDMFVLQHRDDKPEIEAPNGIHFFGGGIEPFDADEEAAIRREVEEETSLRAGNLSLKRVWQGDVQNESGEGFTNVTLFEAELPPQEIGFEVYEGQGKVFVTRDQLAELPAITEFARRVIESDNYQGLAA